MSRQFAFIVAAAFTMNCSTAPAQDPASSRPHVPRQGKNLIVNPSVKTKTNWRFLRDAQYDASTSRIDDGSGSIKLPTPHPKVSMALSDLIAVQPGKKYTYGFYIKTENGPTYSGAQISLHDANRKFIRNHASGQGGTTRDGQWQEFALPFVVPEGVAYIGCQVFKGDSTKPGGVVWADDFYLGQGMGLQQPPSPKRSFVGQHVRVDSLGNFEVKRKGVWTPFFPLCMYADNHRDWSVYSKQGWNVNMWVGSAAQVKQAKEAVSEFNPDGMMSGFSIAQYTMPGGWAYNDLDDLRTRIKRIHDEGLSDSLLLYYWDNEVHHKQWQVPVDVIKTIKSADVDSSDKPLRPVYALQGTFNIARVHAARGLVDVSGTYVGGGADAMGGTGLGGFDELLILDRQAGQVTPAAFAQFNGVDGAGDMRLRLNSIIMGAKGMGYWRDCYKACDENFMKSVGPADKQPWWPDFPNLRPEVDKLLPIIREPHWTSWKAKVDAPGSVHVGTRDHKGEGYLILVNQTSKPQKVTLNLEGLPYAAKEVRDYFDDKNVATISDATFSIVLPKIGVNSGTTVLRVVKQ